MSPRGRFEEAALAYALHQGLLHGSEIVDLAVEQGCGAAAKDAAESWLVWAVETGVLEARAPAPNHSQRAWSGLGGCGLISWKQWSRVSAAGWRYATIGISAEISRAVCTLQ